MVKVRKESNEWDFEEASMPVPVNEDSMEHLEQLRTLFEKQPAAASRRRGKKRKVAPRRYKAVTEKEAAEIWSRYHRGQTASTIARELLLRQPTVFHAIKRMRLRDGHHIDARILNGRKTVRKITPAVEKLLLAHQTLQSWSGLFIRQRIVLLRTNHNVHIHDSTLKEFYKKHKIKYLRVSYQYNQGLAVSPELRYNFAVRIAELRDKNQILIYLDEASFHLWQKKTHTWTHPDRPVRLILGQDRNSGKTVFGAISTSLNRPVFAIESSTNKDAMLRFLRRIREALETDEKGYIVLDRHAAHKSKATAELAE